MLTHMFTFNIVLMSTEAVVTDLTDYIKVVLWEFFFPPVVPHIVFSPQISCPIDPLFP